MGEISASNHEPRVRYAPPSTCGSADGRYRSALACRCARSILFAHISNVRASTITYRTLDVGLRKSIPGSSSVSLGHGVYTDLHTSNVRCSHGKTRDDVPEEPTHTPRTQTRDIEVSEHGLVQVNRSRIVSIRRADKQRQIYVSILPSPVRRALLQQCRGLWESTGHTIIGALRRISSAALSGSDGSVVKRKRGTEMRTMRTSTMWTRIR